MTLRPLLTGLSFVYAIMIKNVISGESDMPIIMIKRVECGSMSHNSPNVTRLN